MSFRYKEEPSQSLSNHVLGICGYPYISACLQVHVHKTEKNPNTIQWVWNWLKNKELFVQGDWRALHVAF